jgi:serine protease Do
MENRRSSSPLRSRRAKLLAGAVVLGAAGLMTVQTIVPAQLAQATPVRIDNAAPADFSDVVGAVSPAVVSVAGEAGCEPRMMNFGGKDNFPVNSSRDLPERASRSSGFFRDFGGRGGEEGQNQRRSARVSTACRRAPASSSPLMDYVVTNQHVIDKGTEFTVIDQDGEGI